MKNTAKLLVLLASLSSVGANCSGIKIETCWALVCTPEEKADGCVDELECFDERKDSEQSYSRLLLDGDLCTNREDGLEVLSRLKRSTSFRVSGPKGAPVAR